VPRPDHGKGVHRDDAAASLTVIDREVVTRWVGEYERAWREDDADAVETLFTETAAYRRSPYEPSETGHEAIKAFWLEDAGRTFSMEATLLAVEKEVAVVRVDVFYRTPVEREYRDLWLLRFAADGRVADFEEWAYWPGKPYSAD
jgi:ketosteroid isomerase-like protein